MALPVFQTSIRELSMLQTQWKSQIEPVLSQPSNSASIVKNINLVAGNNIINHMLGRTPIGWVIIDSNAVPQVYRSQPFNDLTLTLNSAGTVTISLMVF